MMMIIITRASNDSITHSAPMMMTMRQQSQVMEQLIISRMKGGQLESFNRSRLYS